MTNPTWCDYVAFSWPLCFLNMRNNNISHDWCACTASHSCVVDDMANVRYWDKLNQYEFLNILKWFGNKSTTPGCLAWCTGIFLNIPQEAGPKTRSKSESKCKQLLPAFHWLVCLTHPLFEPLTGGESSGMDWDSTQRLNLHHELLQTPTEAPGVLLSLINVIEVT